VTTRDITFAVWAVLVLAFVVAQLIARRTHPLPTLAELIRFVVRLPAVRVAVLVGWLWMGWHFFVRSSR
jgi:hypothetical protein